MAVIPSKDYLATVETESTLVSELIYTKFSEILATAPDSAYYKSKTGRRYSFTLDLSGYPNASSHKVEAVLRTKTFDTGKIMFSYFESTHKKSKIDIGFSFF
jgi:hypothetical protein